MTLESVVQGSPLPPGLAAIGLRTYLEITHVGMVTEAEAGQTVYILARVRNNHTAKIYAAVTVTVNGIEIQGAQAWLQPGGEYSWPMMSFTMPNRSVAGTVAAFYATASPPTEDDWVKDDEKTFRVDLKVPLAGTITRMELEYDGEQDPIPVYDITQGQRALVHIWGRNDTPVNQTLALSWAIRDPDGLIIEEAWDWETWHTGPGGQHHFIIPPGVLDYLNLDKVGTYTIGIALSMNPDNPTVVADYAGNLCTVAAPEFKGTIVRKELEYDGEQDPIPVANIPPNSKALVHIWGRNDTTENRKLGLHWVVYDPDGLAIEEGTDWETAPPGYTGPGGQHHFIIPPGILDYLNLNKQGQYMLSCQLLMNPDSPVTVANYNGMICVVTAVEFAGSITKKELEYDAEQAPIPCDVLVGLHGLVHVWGRNDMDTNQKLGLHWVVYDPDGLAIEEGADWETAPPGYTGPGGEHHFIIPPGIQDYVNFDKVGAYTMSLELLMNPDSPVVVADYDGSLCTVTTEVPPEYELILQSDYPHAYIYEGEAEIGVATFSLPVGPPPIVDWIGNKIINALADKVEEEGSRMLELKVYRRTTLPWVNYRMEATAAVAPQEGVAIWPVLAALPWKAIITAAIFAAIAILVTNLVILPVLRLFFERKPGLSPKVKEKMTKETLISFIMDLRPAYSREELEAMTEQDLEDLADTVYEEEVPPGGIPWWGWCLIGGVGIAGGALALKYLPKKKEEPEKKREE